jgi:hypothetical protein
MQWLKLQMTPEDIMIAIRKAWEAYEMFVMENDQ